MKKGIGLLLVTLMLCSCSFSRRENTNSNDSVSAIDENESPIATTTLQELEIPSDYSSEKKREDYPEYVSVEGTVTDVLWTIADNKPVDVVEISNPYFVLMQNVDSSAFGLGWEDGFGYIMAGGNVEAGFSTSSYFLYSANGGMFTSFFVNSLWDAALIYQKKKTSLSETEPIAYYYDDNNTVLKYKNGYKLILSIRTMDEKSDFPSYPYTAELSYTLDGKLTHIKSAVWGFHWVYSKVDEFGNGYGHICEVDVSVKTVAFQDCTSRKFKITYELDGGQNDPSNPSEYTFREKIELKPATKDGEEFNHWAVERIGDWYGDLAHPYRRVDFSSFDSTRIYGDLKLIAVWKS